MPVGTVVAQNLMDGVTVMSSDIKGTTMVEFGAKDDPEGNDIQYVPAEIVESPAFKRALARGVLGLIEDDSDPEVMAALTRQVEAFQKRQRGAQDQIQATIERTTSRDSISVFCVGPDSRGTGTCDEPVAMPEQQRDEVPPLCSRHKGLASQYVPEHKIVPGEVGKQVIWTRVSLTARNAVPMQKEI